MSTATLSQDAYATLSAEFYGDTWDASDALQKFEETTGNLPLSRDELDDWLDKVQAQPVAMSEVPKTEPAKPVQPSVNPTSVPIPSTPELQYVNKAGLRAIFLAKYGYVPGDSTTAKRLIQAIESGLGMPRCHGAKAVLQAKVAERYGACPKSYPGWKLQQVVNGELAPGGTATIAAMKAKATAKMGVEMPKSYGAKQLAAVIDGTKMPRIAGRRVDGMTADVCKKLLSAARNAGKSVPAYSALKADALRELVAKLGLSVAK